jgi:hypothetical protein
MNSVSPGGSCSLTEEVVRGIERRGLLAVTVTLLLASIGCTAAYNVRTVESPDWKYAASCYVRGAFGRSYVAETKKSVVVQIYALEPHAKELVEKELKEARAAAVWRSNPGAPPINRRLFESKYSLKASSLEWNAVWGPHDDLSISFYDYGPGVSSENVPKRSLRTISYRFDSGAGTYKEEPAVEGSANKNVKSR